MTNYGCVAMTFKPKPNQSNGKCFATIEEIKEKSQQELLSMPKSASQKCFKDWKKRWHKGFALKGTRPLLINK